jgi:uncharacterized protein YyaL (SSP411 family)
MAPQAQPAIRPANRLAKETSPYLLQHAHNPVDWYAWGPAAFKAARERDVPIFLSVGYSTCYWCHVMERESFEDEATGKFMSDKFVCIKLDREERPDVDDIYMNAVQAMTGRGGWPMSVFLEPKTLRPFWAGTYFPPAPAHGMPSFRQVLEALSAAWETRRPDVEDQARAVGETVAERLAAKAAPVQVGREQVGQAVSALLTTFDRVSGGFGGAPKFPQPSYLDLLLEFRRHAGDDESKNAADAAIKTTLDKMALGGVYDQVGGGFHRYSVDRQWTVPHFEKMLYDNAQLAETYARAAKAYDDAFYRRVVRRTLDYVLGEMTAPEGGFYSAQDAEVDGREGLNYLWTKSELTATLPALDASLAADVYGLDGGPNFRDPHHPDEPPSNVLRLSDRPAATALRVGMEPAAFLERMDRINGALYGARSGRRQPRLDDKVLSGWNGLMIGGMAAGGALLGEDRFIRAGARAADFILESMREADGRGLLRSFRAGQAKIPAFLEDYAFLIHGLVELHRAGADESGRYLTAAQELAEEAVRRFGDPATGGFFDTLADQSDLFIRTRSTYDGAIPSGSSVMLENFVDLYELSRRPEDLSWATACLASLSSAIAQSPIATSTATRGLLRLLTIEPAAVGRAFPPGTPQAISAEPAAAPEPVEVYASEETVEVAEGKPAELHVQIRIADGYHINAADPGPGAKDLVPLRVGVIGGTGVSAYADYPEGETFGANGELRIYKGTIDLRIALERHGEWSGRPLLAVTFQACTDTECLLPTTLELDVRIDRP